jgi:hypothetical protein
MKIVSMLNLTIPSMRPTFGLRNPQVEPKVMGLNWVIRVIRMGLASTQATLTISMRPIIRKIRSRKLVYTLSATISGGEPTELVVRLRNLVSMLVVRQMSDEMRYGSADILKEG